MVSERPGIRDLWISTAGSKLDTQIYVLERANCSAFTFACAGWNDDISEQNLSSFLFLRHPRAGNVSNDGAVHGVNQDRFLCMSTDT